MPYGNIAAMARACSADSAHLARRIARRRHMKIATDSNFSAYVAKTSAKLACLTSPNFRGCTELQLRAIHGGPAGLDLPSMHPVHEILVLDDCSRDDACWSYHRPRGSWPTHIRLVPERGRIRGRSLCNGASAAEIAIGELLWIAEADDLSDPGFLLGYGSARQAIPHVKLAFSDSRTIRCATAPRNGTVIRAIIHHRARCPAPKRTFSMRMISSGAFWRSRTSY